MTLIIGFALAAVISVLAWKFDALSPGGAVGATLAGGLSFGLGGPAWAAVLIAFFVGSSLLSAFRSDAKATVTARFAKGSRRDLGQVLANGGLSIVLSIAAGIVTHASPWYPTLTIAYFGALSAATADTWATELGVLSRQRPRLITTGQPVPAGASGGVTWLGLAASIAGGAFIGLTAMLALLLTARWSLAFSLQSPLILLPLLCALAGLIGSMADSLLGATVQVQRFCQTCGVATEREVHTCGQPTRPWRGLRWMTNDAVNLLATCAGAGVVLISTSLLPSL